MKLTQRQIDAMAAKLNANGLGPKATLIGRADQLLELFGGNGQMTEDIEAKLKASGSNVVQLNNVGVTLVDFDEPDEAP